MGKSNSNAINHKEFLTWQEFLGYFEDYQEIEERNRKANDIAQARSNIKKERLNRTQQEIED